MSTEPLWRGPGFKLHVLNHYDRQRAEVEVWPAGDRTSPTREQVRQRMREVIGDCVREDGQGFMPVVGTLQMATRRHWADDGPANLDAIAGYVTEAVMELLG